MTKMRSIPIIFFVIICIGLFTIGIIALVNNKDVSVKNVWYSGTEVPLSDFGKVDDLYLDVDDYNIYKRDVSRWNLIAKIRNNGNIIDINEDGYWVINDRVTEYNAYLDKKDLMQGLLQVFEKHNLDYSPYTKINDYWRQGSSTFSGWGGCIGKPDIFDKISFNVKARGNNITEVKVWLLEGGSSGTIVYENSFNVNLASEESETIAWDLPTAIYNTEQKYYYFAYACNGLCYLYTGTNSTTGEPIEDQTLPKEFDLCYFTNGIMLWEHKRETEDIPKYKKYLYVETSMSFDIFEIKDSIL